jgi:hypothetical protein
MSEESEALFDKADTLDEIRDKASKNSDLEMELQDCIKDVQNILHSRSERLVLKDQYFKCYDAANGHDINGLFQVLKNIQIYLIIINLHITYLIYFIQSMSKIDSSLTRNDTTQAQLTRHTELIRFMKTHCHERAYSFQVQIIHP